MDVDVESSQGNDKKCEDFHEKPPTSESTATKSDQKVNSKQKNLRSRSSTPQNKVEDAKILQISMKKLDVELNGKNLVEENENTEKNSVDTGEEKVSKEVIEGNDADKNDKKNDESDVITQPETNNKSNSSTPKKRTSPRIEKKEKFKKPEDVETEKDTVEMDPLIISDEPDPELQFDENSDMESGKGSPVIPRCVTRRSQTRNIPTPKTPKLSDQDQESEKTLSENQEDVATKLDNLNETCDSTDTADVSTKVAVGSDVTRLEYTEKNCSLPEDTSYLDATRDKSLTETLRGLSARRPIRQTDHYRRTVFRNSQQRSDLDLPYPSHEQVVTGVKRKDRSATPEDTKKFRSDSPGRSSLFSSPFTNLRSRFKSDLPTSTPKLLGYRDADRNLRYQEDLQMADGNGIAEKNSWCSVM